MTTEKIDMRRVREIRTLLTELESKNIEVARAVARKTFEGKYKDQLKNLMFNNRELLFQIVREWMEMKEQYEVTAEALEDADQRIDKLEKALSQLRHERNSAGGFGGGGAMNEFKT